MMSKSVELHGVSSITRPGGHMDFPAGVFGSEGNRKAMAKEEGGFVDDNQQTLAIFIFHQLAGVENNSRSQRQRHTAS